ncbi:hypothetical protein EI94DRAFT_667645 [Lactarius quietus]|nr:hypothetical protein EI94DRAFT_667645 [Lactarius quietus]
MLFNAHLAYLLNRIPYQTLSLVTRSSAAVLLAVIPEFFNEVCPNHTDCKAFNVPLSCASDAAILQALLGLLEHTEGRCVEVKEYSGDSVIREISRYMVVARQIAYPDSLSWSILILAAIAANAHTIYPALSSATSSSFTPSFRSAPFSGLLVLHIRGGDYIDHCMHIAN